MRIERIDEKTVRCFLSNEELEAYQIDYKDFVTRSEKAKEIVQEIIEQASEEVGYKPPKFAFDLQIMMVPDRGLVLTFSDKDADLADGTHLMDCINEMKKLLQETKDKAMMETPILPAGNGKGSKKENPADRPDYAVFAFSSMHTCMNYAAVLPANLRVESSLYKMNQYFYIYMKKGHASYERFSRACVQAMEFGALHTADESRLLFLQEHGECLIPEKALRKLRG